MCDFDTGFKAPEMVKKRPVVVISPRRRRSSAQFYTVVPLSTHRESGFVAYGGDRREHRDGIELLPLAEALADSTLIRKQSLSCRRSVSTRR